MAELEHDLGVTATFYVMARSPYYNPLSHDGKQTLKRIVDLGHTLGVHADLNEPRDSTMTAAEAAADAAREFWLLSTELPVTRALSLHCPPHNLLWKPIPGFDSAYGPEWHGRYYADSEGSFRYGDPEDAPPGRLQINLHPEHWMGRQADHGAFWR